MKLRMSLHEDQSYFWNDPTCDTAPLQMCHSFLFVIVCVCVCRWPRVLLVGKQTRGDLGLSFVVNQT